MKNQRKIKIKENKSTKSRMDSLPILPTRSKVLFPNVVIQLSIGLTSSIALVSTLSKDSFVGIVPFVENSNDLFEFGALAKVIQIVKTNKDSVKFIITLEGVARFKIKVLIQSEPFYSAKVFIHQEIGIPFLLIPMDS